MNLEERIREALNPDREPMASFCCHGNCLQGRACPYREACGPIEPEAPVADWLLKAAAWVAAVLAVGMVVLAAGAGA
jgi:hypothetical protein